MTGQRFGRLLVVSDNGSRHVSSGGRSSVLWQCRCDCGTVVSVMGNSLARGVTKSCGCLQRELVAARLWRHGHHNTATYGSWTAMLQRCHNPANSRWARYGGRGIKVCDRWLVFENFLADLGERPSGKTLDRWPDPDGDYEPSNCRWATDHQQRHNRSALALILLLVFVAVPLKGHSAEMSYCHAYANRGSAAALRQLLGMPFIDPSAGRFLYRKAYSYCLNSDELPSLVFTPEEQPIVDDAIPIPREKPPGLVPAIDPQDEQVSGPPPPEPTKPKKVSDPGPPAGGVGGDQPLCASHHMKTIYTNKHWRCRR